MNVVGAWGQSSLHFESTTLDIGHIDEDGGVVTHSVEACNVGTKPVVVVDVITSCGCTTATFSRKPIAPGDNFTLTIAYNPMNRPGRIDRTISVVTSDSEVATKLHLIGNVAPRERSIYEIYPFDMGGGLRLESNFHAFACIEHGKSTETRIGYVNSSERTIEVELHFERSSGILDIEFPRSMAPGERGDIVLRYTVEAKSSIYGTITDHIRIVTNGIKAQYLLTTYGVVVDNFDHFDDISAPRLEISEKNIKFGDVMPDYGVIRRSLQLHNTGGSTLVVRCIEASHGAVECCAEQNISIEAGQSVEIDVKLDVASINRDEPFASRLQVISNDPIRPLQMVRVTALPM